MKTIIVAFVLSAILIILSFLFYMIIKPIIRNNKELKKLISEPEMSL
ncbi:hypothetical protein FZ921_10340 [Acinetobacter baumannii]|nr:hypothetical protein FZ921_10340 [Acinetobacter baumannii]